MPLARLALSRHSPEIDRRAQGAGAMYACLDLAERIDTHLLLHGSLHWPTFVESLPLPLTVAPRFDYRAIKFNLPWSAYRTGNATVQSFDLSV